MIYNDYDVFFGRFAYAQVVSMDAGPGVASSVDNIMEKVGLKADAATSDPTNRKNGKKKRNGNSGSGWQWYILPNCKMKQPEQSVAISCC